MKVVKLNMSGSDNMTVYVNLENIISLVWYEKDKVTALASNVSYGSQGNTGVYIIYVKESPEQILALAK